MNSNIQTLNTQLYNTSYSKLAEQVTAAVEIYNLFPTPENKQNLTLACTALTLKTTTEGKTLTQVNQHAHNMETAITLSHTITSN